MVKVCGQDKLQSAIYSPCVWLVLLYYVLSLAWSHKAGIQPSVLISSLLVFFKWQILVFDRKEAGPTSRYLFLFDVILLSFHSILFPLRSLDSLLLIVC